MPRTSFVCFASLVSAASSLGCSASTSGPTEPATWPAPVVGTALSPLDTSSPDTTVGNGSPASCSEAAFEAALAVGGVVTFDCGPDPVVITMTSEKSVTVDPTIIDGGGLVTLSGGNTTRILNMDTGDFEATAPRLTVQNITFQYGRATGTATDGGGGAIFYRGGSVTVIDSSFLDNRCELEGPDVAGGAIYGIGVGETRVSGSEFMINRGSNGGAIGALGTAITIVDSVFIDNEATGYGGNAVVGGVQVGMGGNGGAVSMDGQGRTLSVAGSEFRGNLAGMLGSAVFRTSYETESSILERTTFDANLAQIPSYEGRATLYLQGTAVYIQESTISNNGADAFAGVWALDHGDVPGRLHVRNTTIAGNYTTVRVPFTDRGIGAGIIVEGDRFEGTVTHCTITGNAAQFGSGVINAQLLTIRSSIIANEADNVWTPLNCTGGSADGTENVQWPTGMGDEVDCTVGITRADPMMGALGDNGGPTQTVVPGDAALVQVGTDCLPTDQRGQPRNSPCTLGALEL